MLIANDSNNHELIFAYDSLNRLTQENQSGAIVNYTYDVNNNLTSITNPNNKITNYEYDTLNRLTTIKQNNETIINNNYTGLENTSINYGNNVNTTKTYDELMRASSLNNGLKTYNYTYDEVGNITNDNHKTYSYDDIYRVKQVNDTNNSILLENFDYDNLGNRTTSYNQATGSGANYSYTKNNLNQYTALSGSILSYQLQEIIETTTSSGTTETSSGTTETGSGTTESGSGTTTGTGEITTTTITYTGSLVTTNENIDYLYDNNGNLKQDNKYKYYYDYKNRLVKATNLVDETLVEFSYDVLNRRFLLRQGFEGQAPKTTKTFVYANENILQETTTDTTTNTTKTRDYINGLGVDELVSFEENSQRYYYHKDHLGSIVGLTNNNRDTIVEYDYDVFGKAKVISGDTNFENNRLYTGREYDAELGLYYNRARYYNPELARFISRDPIDIADDVNLYAYVGNNGVMFVDRSGNSKASLAYNETKEFLQYIINNNLNLGENKYRRLYGRKIKLNDSEYEFYSNDFDNIFDLYQLNKNKNSAFDNKFYNASVNYIENMDIYKEQYNKYGNEMFSKLGWDSTNNVYSDAIRHSYFNALNAKYFGLDDAKKIGDYHEALNGNIGQTAVIDLYNNSIGRSIGYENKDKSDEEILEILFKNSDKLIFGRIGNNGKLEMNDLYNNVENKLNLELKFN